MKKKTVCILTSGTGSRLEDYTTNKNKSLLAIKKESILSKILNNFPKNTNFIVSVGYKSNQVRDFIKIHHSDLNIKFVNIKNFSGKKSGPALSLFKCKSFLQKPFYFVSCDTLWTKKIFHLKSYNWMGSFKSKKLNTLNYCNLITRKDKIIKIIDKKKIFNKKNLEIFVGLAFIKDFKTFWDGFNFNQEGEPQISMGFKNLLRKKKSLKKVHVDWEDTGTKKNYENLVNKYEKYNFNKEDQQIYISKDKVTKFFNNKKTIINLFEKAKLNKKVYPEKLITRNNFISYKFIKGKTLYKSYNLKNFKSLLLFLEKNLWNKKNKKTKKFKEDCVKFYYSKTHDRVNKFLKNSKSIDIKNLTFKRVKLLQIKQLLKIIDWKNIFNGIPVSIHGDLQFDNIIQVSKNNFKLIDWRPKFGNNIDIGDLYYDYAKLLGGLLINYDLVKQNRFKIKISNQKVNMTIPSRSKTNKLITYFENYLINKQIDTNKVKILTGIIFINMSPLHHHPFDKLLFLYGKYFLQKNLILKND